MSKPKTKTEQNSAPHVQALKQLQSICGAPALLPGEDAALYEALREQLWRASIPRDFIEALWVQDWVDWAWQEWRLRRGAAGVIHAAISEAIHELLRPALGHMRAEAQSRAYAAGGKAERKQIEVLLKQFGYGEEDVRAKAVEISIHKLHIIDRMQASLSARRMAGVREMTRYRERAAPAIALPAPAKDEDAEHTRDRDA